jgi:DNA invertase Pin-like site-specific DNA recombinase
MIYGYVRVSTDRQETDNQKFEIERFCKKQNLKIDEWVEETISGTKEPKKRKLGPLLDKVGKDDLIICSEVSRLGRKLFMIMIILQALLDKGAKVWTIKDNYRLGDDIQSKILAFAFGIAAEIERDMISQRTKEALARKVAQGVILGRPLGRRSSHVKLTGHEKEIKQLRKHGFGKSELGRKFGVNRMTVDKFMKDNGIK